jgi:hypothetical protein
VSISGDTIVVGAYLENSNTKGVNGIQSNIGATDSGATYVFVRGGTTWSQQAYLKASNTGAGDNFGWSVSISGDTIVVGAHHEDSNATGVNGDQDSNFADNSGAAYVFVRDRITWTQQAYVKADSVLVDGQFGCSVFVDEIIVIGQCNGNSAFVFDTVISTTGTGTRGISDTTGTIMGVQLF